jgi:hypothetical protein
VVGATDNYPTAPSSGLHRPDTRTPPHPVAQRFPALCLPTGALWVPEHDMTTDVDGRGVMMPKRRRTRAENLRRRIGAERKLNDDYVAERNKPPPF